MTRARRSRGGHRSRAGFTLVEITVALAAGLLVALGIVGLSREANRTFHEEVRASASEATLRTAVDRLRVDLQRAGYMSTGNIMADTSIAKPLGATNVANTSPAMAGIKRLASVHLIEGGSQAQNNLTLSTQQTPALAPDATSRSWATSPRRRSSRSSWFSRRWATASASYSPPPRPRSTGSLRWVTPSLRRTSGISFSRYRRACRQLVHRPRRGRHRALPVRGHLRRA